MRRQDWSDVTVLPHSHEDHGSAVLDLLEWLEVPVKVRCISPALRKKKRHGQVSQQLEG